MTGEELRDALSHQGLKDSQCESLLAYLAEKGIEQYSALPLRDAVHQAAHRYAAQMADRAGEYPVAENAYNFYDSGRIQFVRPAAMMSNADADARRARREAITTAYDELAAVLVAAQ